MGGRAGGLTGSPVDSNPACDVRVQKGPFRRGNAGKAGTHREVSKGLFPT